MTPVAPDDDLGLIRAVAQRDRRAFEALYYRFAPRLGRYLSRLVRERELVEEVVNDVMLVVWESAGRYDPAASRLSTWLFGIAHNKALKALARRSRQLTGVSLDAFDVDPGMLDNDHPAAGPRPHDPERTLMGRELGQALECALEDLSAEHRAVIELAFGQDCSYEEIATITGCPVNTVKTRMFYARRQLAQLLAARGFDRSVATVK